MDQIVQIVFGFVRATPSVNSSFEISELLQYDNGHAGQLTVIHLARR
jgi:hypothetical protein